MLTSIKTANLTDSISRNAGGLFQSVRRLVQTLDDQGLKVGVFGTADEFTAQDIELWKPVEVRAFRPLWPRKFGYSPEFLCELERFAPDLTHTHGIWVYPSIATNRYSRRRGIPYMISPHGMLDPWALRNSRWKKVVAYLLYENAHLHEANCIRALCESEARAIREAGLKNPIAIIPNGIDLPDFPASVVRPPSSDFSVSGFPLSASENLTSDLRPPTSGSGAGPSSSSPLSAIRHQTAAPSILPSPLEALRASGRKTLLFLSRIHPKKGLPNLLRAWKSVTSPSSGFCPQSSNWTLAIAGWDQGGHETELKRLCDVLGIKWADIREANPSPPRSGRCLSPPWGEGGRRPDEVRRTNDSNAPGEVSNALPPSAFRPPSPDASVFFVGPQFGAAKDIAYQNCDAFILPSFSEGVPMVVLEAWAYHKPAIITPECNLPEAFPRGAAVRIETNPDDIARGLRAFFEMSESQRAAMGAAGRQWMEQKYTWPYLGRQMGDVYEWLLGSGPAPSCLADF